MRGGLLAAGGVAAMAWNSLVLAQPAAQPPASEVDTLREALIQTYATNPTIMTERARLRATDEGVALARSEGRPQLSSSVGVNQDVVSSNLGPNRRDLTVGADLTFPLFAGGRVRNSVRAANVRVEGGRADLRATEGNTFTEAVSAYMDVIRDRAIVALNENQVRVLDTNLQATRDRFEVGDLTRTDVAQSEARLALARSTLVDVRGRLESSEENYRRIIGVLPGDLQPPPALPRLPGTADQAATVALANNAALQSIVAQARAAGFDVRVARGARLPTISASSGTRYFNALGSADNNLAPGQTAPANSTTSTGVGLLLTLPLYQGGAASAQVRRAQAIRSSLIEQSIGVERSVVSNARSAFATYQAANEAIESNTIAVAANELALEGTRAEQSVGTRNILDVLNAEQELLNANVLLVTARRDAYVAGFQLLNVMGLAEAEDLNLDGGALYDPTIYYERYSDTWSDWNDGPPVRAVSTRTAPPDAISPVTQLPQ